MAILNDGGASIGRPFGGTPFGTPPSSIAASPRPRVTASKPAKTHVNSGAVSRKIQSNASKPKAPAKPAAPKPAVANNPAPAAPKPPPISTTPIGQVVIPPPTETFMPQNDLPGPITQQVQTPPPAPPSIEDFLGLDTGYLGQMQSLQKALSDFQAGQLQQRNQFDVQNTQQLRDLGIQQEQQQKSLQEDFAARGLANSGAFANALGDLNQGFLGQQTALNDGRASFMSQLEQALADFQAQQNMATQTARQDAINRRAEKFNLPAV